MDFLYILSYLCKAKHIFFTHMSTYKIEKLPLDIDFETKKVLKKVATAHRALAELKGIVASIPNQTILINTLSLQEAKDSSEIENIITTHDELYKSELSLLGLNSLAAKEVQNYISALKKGYALIQQRKVLTTNNIIEIQLELEQNDAGFRKVPGTSLKNQQTGEVIYMPPQNHSTIVELMRNLEIFINDDNISDLDPLVKMALIHFQFESIHPFYDGNGRTGRIINVLYLVMKDLLDLPILYLSKYIIQHKASYYNLLQKVRDEGSWEEWICYMLDAIEYTAKDTIKQVKQINELMLVYKHKIRDEYKFYSQDLLNNLFKHPYTKIEFLEEDLGVSRVTASNYLNTLAKDGLLIKQKLGVSNYYINHALYKILT